MKKTFLFLLVTGFVFFLGACNTDAPSKDDDDPEDVEWSVDYLYPLENSESYPGAEVDLSGRKLLDISKYSSVTVNATLYSDEAGSVKATAPAGDNKNLAQFKLLKATGDWDKESNICGSTKYNMAIEGDTTWNVPASASGVPGVLLLQANWADFTEDGTKVKSIKVHKIIFTAKTSDWSLDVVYPDDGSKVTVTEGNKITFNSAAADHAVILIFSPDWTITAGKSIKIAFTIPDHEHNPSTPGATDVEHQLRIQAANSEKVDGGYKYVNFDGDYQLYPTLDSTGETGWSDTTHSGTLKIEGSDLSKLIEAATKTNDDSSKGYGPFALNAIRFVNDGTTWTGGTPSATHVRCKSYTLVIDSVTVE